MFIVLLKFSDNKDQAGEHMDGHNRWVKNGFDDNVFILAGSIKPGLGGVIFAHNTSPEEIEGRVNNDPFIINKVVTADILDISPAKTNEDLQFLAD